MSSELSLIAGEPSRESPSKLDCLLVGMVFVVGCVGAIASLPTQAKIGDEPVAIVFAPWVSGDDAIARSVAVGHRILRTGRTSSIVIAAPPNETGVELTKPEGALFSVSLSGISGCLDAGKSAEPTT